MAREPNAESYPLAAQIPLQSFILPDFPPQASRLRELTLTSDIKLDEYQTLLQQHGQQQAQAVGLGGPEGDQGEKAHRRSTSLDASDSLIFHMGSLPDTINSLTLELFSLGLPAGWLGGIGRHLPQLKSLVLFATLIDGLDERSRNDSAKFLAIEAHLRDLHVIDSFARPGFWKDVAQGWKAQSMDRKSGSTEEGLQFLEMSYTYRGHTDPDFMKRLAGEEFPELLGTGQALVAASFNLSPPPPSPPDEHVPEDPGNLDENGELFDNTRPEGVSPFGVDSNASDALRKKIENLSASEGKPLAHLKMLNLSMWTLRPHEVGQVVYACSGGSSGQLVDLTVSVLMEGSWWNDLLASLVHKSAQLEGLEVIAVPSSAADANWKGAREALDKNQQVGELRNACPKLVRFEMTILRSKSLGKAEYMYEEDEQKWKGGFTSGETMVRP